MALDKPKLEDLEAVRAVYPQATAMSDYTPESAWSEVRSDHDEDGLAIGEMLASGRTQEEAWKNAADSLRERVTRTTETINLTPRGMTTPEGNARVNKAMEEFEDANATVANAATQFFDAQRLTLLEVSRGISICEDDRLALKDALHQLDALIGARQRKQEELLRAVAGVPPAQ